MSIQLQDIEEVNTSYTGFILECNLVGFPQYYLEKNAA